MLTNTNKDNSHSSHICSHSDCDSRYQQPVDERPGAEAFCNGGTHSRMMITMCAFRSVLENKNEWSFKGLVQVKCM